MKSNSYSRVVIVSLSIATMVLSALLWPTTGHSQSSSRRDRYRRDTPSRFESSKTDRSRQQAPAQKAPVTKSAEPKAAEVKSAGATKVAGANEAATPRPDEVAPPVESLSREASGPEAAYNVISQRNIFSRQRIPYRPRDRSETPVVVVPNPETHFVLKGLVQENNQFIAFIEDTQAGGVLQLRQGDKVARGAIKTLNLDALEYQLEDKTISVKLGCDLEGTRAPVTVVVEEPQVAPQTSAPAATSTSASTGAPALTVTQPPKTGQPTPAPTGGNEADILRRLMEQRRQQLGQ